MLSMDVILLRVTKENLRLTNYWNLRTQLLKARAKMVPTNLRLPTSLVSREMFAYTP